VITNPSGVLTPAQLAVADEILSAEEQSRRHLAIYLSGSHAYGFPSPDSDLDLKAVHTEPTRNLLGLSPRPHSAARLEVVRGVEVDYTSNEIGTVLAGILGGNGNYV
jgi:predicted nucleotidyltransferase